MTELEQLVRTEKKSAPGDAKAKKIEGTYAEDKGSKEDFSKAKKPRFILTDQGCRRGAQCSFGHETRDGRSRCYVCGATSHFTKDCPRKIPSEQAAKKDFKQGAPKIAKVETDEGTSSVCETEKGRNAWVKRRGRRPAERPGGSWEDAQIPNGDLVKQSRPGRQVKQLNEMKLRKFGEAKISKMDFRNKMGLLDSGAPLP